jgi:hypothetical protein
MRRLDTLKALREVQHLPFCYVCGVRFEPDDTVDRDHVPAKACFAEEDRNGPLILPTHVRCNGENKLDDEKLGQLIALRRKQVASVENRRLRFRFVYSPEGHFEMGGVNNLDIHAVVRRWLRACHAALYGEALPEETIFAIETPFQMGVVQGEKIRLRPLREPQHRTLVATIKQERAGENLDGVRCNKGKFAYDCVWERFDGGEWFCAFGVDLYDWADLGEQRHFAKRGCAGFYVLPSRNAPPTSARATGRVTDFANASALDPFSD